MEDFRAEIIKFIDKYFECIVKYRVLCFFIKDGKVKPMELPDHVFEDDVVDVEALIGDVCNTFELDDIDFQQSHKLFSTLINYYDYTKDREGYFGFKKSFRSLIPAIGSFFQIVNRYNRIR